MGAYVHDALTLYVELRRAFVTDADAFRNNRVIRKETQRMARRGMGMDISLKVAVTDRKVKELGASMVAEMSEINWANRRGNTYDAGLRGWALMGTARTLEILEIPCKRERNEQGEYVSVTIAGVTFPVEMGG